MIEVSEFFPKLKVLSFSIYYLEYYFSEEVKAAKVPYKNQSFYESLSDEELENFTKNAIQRVIHGLKNDGAKNKHLFCPRSPDLEVNLTY